MPDVESKAGGNGKAAAAPKKKSAAKRSLEGIKHFLSETKAEFRKIVWPTREVTVRQTVVVLIAILVIGAVIWCIDALTGLGLGAFLKNY